ncbi:hypothetical protein Tco_1451671 [Tanacetum coccineum]
MYVSPPSITTVRPWFAMIEYNREIEAKSTLKKSCLPPRWRLLMGQIIQCLGGKTGGLDQISNKDATILYCLENGVKEATKGGSSRAPTGYKTSHFHKSKESGSTIDTSPSHPSPPTLVVGEMHKEAQQAAGGPTSLRATSEEGSHPQLSSGHDASADSTAEVDPGISAPRSNPSVLVNKTKSARDGLKTTHTTSGTNEETRADDILQKVKLEDLLDILKDTRSAFFTSNSPIDEPIIVSDETSHDFASCLPTELKELPSKVTKLSREIKELKQHIRDMEIELPGDLVEIPTKLETFTSTISSLSSQVTDTLNMFSIMVDNASGATSMNVPLAGQAATSPAEGEKNTKDAGTNLKDKLINLLGKYVVTRYYTKKLLFDKYYDKILKRKKTPNITNYEVLTKKGPITLKIYREDGSDEVVSNLKVSDLHST